MFKTEKAKLPALLEKIGEARDLIVPVLRCGQVNFELWERESQADLETLKTSKSPKDVFFPQSETLYSCIRDGKKISVKAEELRDRPFVVFGMKSCDVKALEVLDRVFLDEPADTYYQARREMGTVVSLACREPEETCFCRAFGIDCAEHTRSRVGCGGVDDGCEPVLEATDRKREGSDRTCGGSADGRRRVGTGRRKGKHPVRLRSASLHGSQSGRMESGVSSGKV